MAGAEWPEVALSGCYRLTGALLWELTGARVEAAGGSRGSGWLTGTLREFAAARTRALGGCVWTLLPGEFPRLRAGTRSGMTGPALRRARHGPGRRPGALLWELARAWTGAGQAARGLAGVRLRREPAGMRAGLSRMLRRATGNGPDTAEATSDTGPILTTGAMRAAGRAGTTLRGTRSELTGQLDARQLSRAAGGRLGATVGAFAIRRT
ncbi:hypothetical protein AB0L62_25680 [Nocardia asteroides]|uniref:hypothetical protein n=1 Tax=Nocardia asteroides TaxID=1824 RepID=UPI00343BFD92